MKALGQRAAGSPLGPSGDLTGLVERWHDFSYSDPRLVNVAPQELLDPNNGSKTMPPGQ